MRGKNKVHHAPQHKWSLRAVPEKKPHPPGGRQSVFFREGERFVYCTFPACVLARFHSYSGMGGVCSPSVPGSVLVLLFKMVIRVIYNYIILCYHMKAK